MTDKTGAESEKVQNEIQELIAALIALIDGAAIDQVTQTELTKACLSKDWLDPSGRLTHEGIMELAKVCFIFPQRLASVEDVKDTLRSALQNAQVDAEAARDLVAELVSAAEGRFMLDVLHLLSDA